MQVPFQQEAHKIISEYSKILKNSGFSVSELIKKVYNYEVLLSKGNDKLKLLVYYGKKGVKPDLQGNSKLKIYKDVKTIIFGSDLFEQDDIIQPEFDEYIGTDESGKGDYFGPLVICAAYVNKETSNKLTEIGVKDSKLLNDKAIKSIIPKIKIILNDNYNIVIINPKKYNELYESFGNLNKIMGWAHSKAIENLILKVNCRNIISDKFGNDKLIADELRKKIIEVKLFQITKAEKFIGVAAASILARGKVIDWFGNKSRALKVTLPKGGGQEVTKIAKSVLDQIGKENMMEMIKFHFKNSKNIFINN